MCVEAMEWEEHRCEECENFFCEVEQCEECGLCIDCCESNSDCSEGLCVENQDYYDHFCEICGNCFCEVDLCDSCYDAGYLICENCCQELAEAQGCDCMEHVCVNSDEFEDHLEDEHSDFKGGEHKASPTKSYNFDDEYHWHDCKLCDSEDHYTSYEKHTFNTKGYCIECGYQKDGVISIVKNPKSVNAKVSNVNAADNDELHSLNNIVKFACKAYGKGTLTFEWYQVINGNSVKKLENHSDDYSICTIEIDSFGNMSILTISVPTDCCCNTYSYYCVVSDAQGNNVKSAEALLYGKHVYALYDSILDGEEKQFVYENNVTRKYTESSGHKQMCTGEGCGKTKSIKLQHVYGVATEAVDAKGNTWKKRSCTLCGYTKYIEEHVHSWNYEGIGENGYVYDSASKKHNGVTSDGRKYYVTLTHHAIACDYSGCGYMNVEYHEWMDWQSVSPVEKQGDVGALYRECKICGYQQDTIKDAQGKVLEWKFGTHPVVVKNGTANHPIVADGEKIRLTFNGDGKSKCIGWNCTYKDSELKLSYTKNEDGQFESIIPTLGDAETLYFTPILETCDHSKGTEIRNAQDAVCKRNGYTGDEVCKECGYVVKEGSDIAAPGTHTGTLNLIEGTGYQATCSQKGYEGDYKCSACGEKVKGKKTAYAHDPVVVFNIKPTFLHKGYSGDRYCKNCHILLSEGQILDKLKVEDYVSICNQVPYSITPILGEIDVPMAFAFDAKMNSKLAEEGYYIESTVYVIKDGKNVDVSEPTKSEHVEYEVCVNEPGDYNICYCVRLYNDKAEYQGIVSFSMTYKVEKDTCNHNYQIISDTATCGTDGKRYSSCSICGKIKTEKSNATGKHVTNELYINGGQTCYKKCMYCGQKIDEHNHNYVITEDEKINCTESYRVSKCSYCHDVKKEYVSGLNNHVYNSNYAKGHDENYHWQYCTKCGYKLKESHTFDEDNYCTDFQCLYHKDDKASGPKALDGSYLILPMNACIHQKVTVDTSACTKDILKGATFKWYVYSYSHKPIATGTTIDLNALSKEVKDAIASSTLTVNLEKDGWVQTNGSVQLSPYISIKSVKGNCAHPGNVAYHYCTLCDKAYDDNYNVINPIDNNNEHSYTDDCDSTCDICGFKRSAPHNFGETYAYDNTGHWKQCVSCGYIKNAQTHTEGEWKVVKQATCTTIGQRQLLCAECEYVLLTEEIKESHNYVAQVIPGGCLENGSRVWTCTLCKDSFTETIPAMGHQITKIEAKAGNCMFEGNLEHYECLSCGSYFSDLEGKNEITKESVTTPKDSTNHAGIVEYKTDDKTHTPICVCGNDMEEAENHSFKKHVCTVCGYVNEGSNWLIWLIIAAIVATATTYIVVKKKQQKEAN